ncbi:MAG TPA: hypothetical protein VK469_07060, partial [Candidatus Kapabacteria bacterium]|nr:hypothetical protein [Candidatus Kapabacteria bacterium]
MWPLLDGGKNFNRLFPLRFDSIITLFSQLDGEAIEHILRKKDSNALRRMFFLSKLGMLDITNTLMPNFKNFYLVYISKINLGEKPYLTEGISISGFGDSKKVYFRLSPDHRSDSTSLQESNLYLINREKQIGFHEFSTDSEEHLTPDDYMSLTPLLLYTTFKEPGKPGEKEPQETEATDQKELFVFQGYESNSAQPDQKFLKFLEFSGKRIEQIKSKKSQFHKLFEDYESFARNLADYYIDIEKLFKKVALEQNIDKPENFKFVFYKTWDLSLGHISSLLRLDEYDSEAALIETVEKRNEKVKFIEKLFVSPKEEVLLDKFLDSDKRGLIIIGKSGMGKSNLLCAGFLKQRRKYELNIFIDARRLESIEIKDSLKKSIAGRIHEDWELKEFDNFLQSNQKRITVFIDAVNEYNNLGGALGLLEKICDLVEDANIFKNLKIVASCRNETWDQYKKKIGNTGSILNEKYFFTQSGDAVTLTGFEEGRQRESLYSSYQKYYKLRPESYHSLSPAVKDLIKRPFMMGFIAEIYSNRYGEVPASAKESKLNTIPEKLDYFILFEYLTERKQEDAKRL